MWTVTWKRMQLQWSVVIYTRIHSFKYWNFPSKMLTTVCTLIKIDIFLFSRFFMPTIFFILLILCHEMLFYFIDYWSCTILVSAILDFLFIYFAYFIFIQSKDWILVELNNF